jgi:hypothetical protein
MANPPFVFDSTNGMILWQLTGCFPTDLKRSIVRGEVSSPLIATIGRHFSVVLDHQTLSLLVSGIYDGY